MKPPQKKNNDLDRECFGYDEAIDDYRKFIKEAPLESLLVLKISTNSYDMLSSANVAECFNNLTDSCSKDIRKLLLGDEK